MKIIRSKKRKTISIELSEELELIVRVPYRMSSSDIDRFIEAHKDWIARNRERLSRRIAGWNKNASPRLTEDELRSLKARAREYIPLRVRHYAGLIGVSYGRITIRSQRTRWGSCSAKGNLNFNCLLMLAPPEVLDSVVVHELCHRRHMDHSRAFYAEVYRVFPDYDIWDRWLKEHGRELMRRLPAT